MKSSPDVNLLLNKPQYSEWKFYTWHAHTDCGICQLLWSDVSCIGRRLFLAYEKTMMERSNTTLLIRHLPKELSHQEKIDLLCHFGAESARPMGDKGQMKHTAFAKFETTELAERGLRRLHQLEILGCKLVAEFAKTDHKTDFPTGITDSNTSKSETSDGQVDLNKSESKLDLSKHEDPFLHKHKIPYPRKPSLYYHYPPPTVSTLTNIANALASHPKFYTQVLHLMNKMNLPCPFGAVTASPPLALDSHKSSISDNKSANDNVGNFGEIEEVEMEEEESEIESDGGEPTLKEYIVSVKTKKRPHKRMKLVKPDMSMVMKPINIPKPSEIFENVDDRKASQIVFNISGSEANTVQQFYKGVTYGKTSDENVEVIEGGFGKVEPITKSDTPVEIEKPDVNYKLDSSQFLKAENIAAGRLKRDQMKEFSVFKNYSRGEPTCRLYIKNLTKQTTEQDIVNLFGGFVNWNLDNAAEAFDIRLMKEGRMKGQSFVTLPDEASAIRIIDNCNGFVINTKPIVIQFARSARAKEVDKPVE